MTFNPQNIAVFGASGAIGSAFLNLLYQGYPKASIFGFSRYGPHIIDYSREDSLAEAAEIATREKPLDLVIVATGMLHEGALQPE